MCSEGYGSHLTVVLFGYMLLYTTAHSDLSDGHGLLLGVGSSIDSHAQLPVDLAHRDGEDLTLQVVEAGKRLANVRLCCRCLAA